MTAAHNTLALVPGIPLLARLHSAINHALLRAWCAAPSGWGRGTIRSKPKGPVLENTISVEVAGPTFKRAFVTSKFLGLVRLHRPGTVSDGMGSPAKAPARLRTCFQHPVHLLRLKTQTVASLHPVGAKTMTTSPVASRSAAPTTTPTTGNTTHFDPVALHFEAVNACAMARWYAARHRHTEAARKLRQGLAALRRLAAFERAEAAA